MKKGAHCAYGYTHTIYNIVWCAPVTVGRKERTILQWSMNMAQAHFSFSFGWHNFPMWMRGTIRTEPLHIYINAHLWCQYWMRPFMNLNWMLIRHLLFHFLLLSADEKNWSKTLNYYVASFYADFVIVFALYFESIFFRRCCWSWWSFGERKKNCHEIIIPLKIWGNICIWTDALDMLECVQLLFPTRFDLYDQTNICRRWHKKKRESEKERASNNRAFKYR